VHSQAALIALELSPRRRYTHLSSEKEDLPLQEVSARREAQDSLLGSWTGEDIPLSFSNVCVPPMSDVTRVLSAIEQGDPHAAEQLLPLVYDELRKLAARKLAQENPGQTLQATALVHEAYLRLVDTEKAQHWNSRSHFFAAAAEAMRRILIESARSKARAKHGGDWQRVDFEELDVVTSVSPDQLVALDDALARLAALDQLAGELVKLRYFAGLALDQAAAALGVSTATAYRHWAYARAWLRSELLNDT
jgi:RNA polymerase sigma factor (TIGR02999 family)